MSCLTRNRLGALLLLGFAQAALAAPNHLVISQVYGGGGNSGAMWKNDFIEVYNPTASAVSVSGWSVQYAPSTGSSWQVTNLTGSILPNSYYLIQESAGTGGTTSLPTPDATGTINMAAGTGKVALVSSTTALTGAANPGLTGLTGTCPTMGPVVDFVGYGNTTSNTANCSETAPAPTLTNTTSDSRKLDGSNVPIDTDNNSTDFQTGTPVPHNSGFGTVLSISHLNPASVTAGGAAFSLAISGSDFGSDSVVNFSGQASIVPSSANITPGSITVTIPASYISSAGTPAISVTSGGVTSNSLTLTVSSATPTCTETETIAQIQGTGRKSTFVSTTVQQTSQGIVTYKKSNGFFMQMAVGDGNVNTSDAIFVFTSSAPTVNLGDLVCVTALVDEFYNGGTTITTDPDNTLTEYSSPSVVTISTGNALPAQITLTPDPAGAFDQFEKYEGMRVQVGSVTVVGPGGSTAIGANAEADGTYTASGSFWGVLTGTSRPFREPGVESSHPIYVENSSGADYGLLPVAEPVFDSNLERIEIYTGNPGATVLDVAVGAVVMNLSGVLDVYFGDFEFAEDATTTPGYVATSVSNNSLTFTGVPQSNASELTIGAFNMEHFYDDQLNGTGTPFEIVLTTPTYQGRLAKASMAIRNVLHTPDILGVEEMENLTTLQALATKIGADAVANGQPNPNYVSYLVQGNDPSGINVAFLVNPARVTNVSTTQYFATDTYTGTTITFDRPPLLLTGMGKNTNGAPLPVTVIINHLKALPADDPTDASTRSKRQAQAQEMAQFIQSLQTANPGILLAVMGDLNSFEFNDGINDVVGELIGNPAPASQVVLANTNVVSPGLTELSSAFLASNQRYSYSESGNAQQLDHILLSGAAMSRATRFAIAHLDADFSTSLKYDYTRPERLSDHDAEVAYLSLPQATDVTASMTVFVSGLIFNRATQLYYATVTLKNISSNTIDGPLQLFFNGLSAGVTLANATGSQGGILPYITSTGSLAPNATVAIPVQFRVQGSARFGYTNTVFSGTL
jgi:predicted extracellular nuclease